MGDFDRKCEYPKFFKGICGKNGPYQVVWLRRSPAYHVWVCHDHIKMFTES